MITHHAKYTHMPRIGCWDTEAPRDQACLSPGSPRRQRLAMDYPTFRHGRRPSTKRETAADRARCQNPISLRAFDRQYIRRIDGSIIDRMHFQAFQHLHEDDTHCVLTSYPLGLRLTFRVPSRLHPPIAILEKRTIFVWTELSAVSKGRNENDCRFLGL